MKKISFILAFVFCSVSALLNSCKPEDPCDRSQVPANYTYEVSKQNKDKIPFQLDGEDVLIYINDQGTVDTLIGLGINKHFITETKNRNANPECPLYDTWNFENIVYTFNGKIIPNITYRYYIDRQGLQYVKFEGSIKGGSGLWHLNDTAYYKDKVPFMGDSLNVIGIYTSGSNTEKSIYYNHQYGIVQVKVNGMIWTKLQ